VPYPRENLNPHETVVLDLHPHWWVITPSILALLASVALGITAIALDWPDPARIAIGVVVLACLAWFGYRELQLITTNFVLTSDRVIFRWGIVSKNGNEIPLERINAIRFQQKWWERLLGLGDLVIQSAAEGSNSLFEDIRRPNRVQNEIYLQMEQNENRKFDRVGNALDAHAERMAAQPAPAAAPAPPAQPSLHDQISQLAALRDAGHITEAEFEAKKTELLGRL
jgi:uncharacterized membrane protein YdbT with pleckstrin-like domain